MNCQECDRLERHLRESFVFVDRAQTAMRCFFFTHPSWGGVSDFDEYLSIHAEEQKMEQQRHNVYLALVEHKKRHGVDTTELSGPSAGTTAVK